MGPPGWHSGLTPIGLLILALGCARLSAADSTQLRPWREYRTIMWLGDSAGQSRPLAFERNINYQMSEELKQAGGNELLEQPIELDARLSQAWHLYDLREQRYLGQADHIRFKLDPWQPSLFALMTTPIPVENLMATLLRESH